MMKVKHLKEQLSKLYDDEDDISVIVDVLVDSQGRINTTKRVYYIHTLVKSELAEESSDA